MKRILSSIILLLITGQFLVAKDMTGIKIWGSNFIDISGYHFLNNDTNDSLTIGGLNTLSLNFQNKNKRYSKFEGNVDLMIPFGYTADQFTQMIDEGDTLDTPYNPIFVQGNTPILIDIRKLYLSAYLPFADVSLGRQIINFGKAFVFSPIDVFSTVDIADIHFRRHGSDVAAVKIPFGFLSGMDLITEFPRKQNEYSSAMRLYHNIFDFDIAANAIYKHRNKEFITGLSFKGDAFLGVYGELVEHFTNDFADKYFEGMLGADYSIHTTYFFRIEYLYKNPNIASLWGKHNIFISFDVMVNELIQLSGNILASDILGESATTMYTGQFMYNILQNVDVLTYVRFFSYKQDTDTLPDLEYTMRVEVKF